MNTHRHVFMYMYMAFQFRLLFLLMLRVVRERRERMEGGRKRMTFSLRSSSVSSSNVNRVWREGGGGGRDGRGREGGRERAD